MLVYVFSDSHTKTRVHKYRFRVVDLSALAKFAPQNPQSANVVEVSVSIFFDPTTLDH